MSSKKGFASMDKEKQRQIASKGGKASHANGNAHQFTSDEARLAGAIGGRVVSQDREHMRRIAKIGASMRSKKAATA